MSVSVESYVLLDPYINIISMPSNAQLMGVTRVSDKDFINAIGSNSLAKVNRTFITLRNSAPSRETNLEFVGTLTLTKYGLLHVFEKLN